MFDYHNYLALIAAICAAAKDGDADAAEDLGFLRDAVKNFVGYVAAVDLSEVGIDTAPGLLEGEALRTEVTALDRDRSTHHNAAIASALPTRPPPAFPGKVSTHLDVSPFALPAV